MKKNFKAPAMQIKTFGGRSIMTLSGITEGTNAYEALQNMTKSETGGVTVAQENVATLLLK